MKYFRLLALCLIIFALICLASCSSADRLATPKGVKVEYETLTLKWDAVDGAKTYTVTVSSEGKDTVEKTVSKDYYSLDELDEGKYEITVKASDTTGKKENSYPSLPVEFIRDKELGLIFTLINGGKEYELSDARTATGIIDVPATYRQRPVTSIGERAFFGKSDVTEIKLPKTITKVGSFAFSNCSYLKKINLPTNITELGESAFSGCRALEGRLEIPEKLTKIPKGAFAYCASLTEVVFPETLTEIGESAFTDCSALKALRMPLEMKKLGGFAFAACSGVTSVTFNNKLEYIGEFAFSKAISISSITIPDSVKYIGSGAFYYCSSLADITLGEGIEVIDHSAFLDTALYKNTTANEVYVGKWFICLKEDTAVRVDLKPDTVGIANNAFYGSQALQQMELPNSVKYVGALAFAGSNLVSVVTGSGVEHIGDQAFLYCDKLSTVVLGSFDYVSGNMEESNLKTIGTYAFMSCTLLERIEIPESVNDIGAYAFRNTGIYNDTLTGIVYAGDWVVDFNEYIQEEITIAEGTRGIARYSFYNCKTLTSVRIPGSVSYICKGAFYNCSALERVTLPDALKVIEDYTFYACSRLTGINLPPMLEKIGRSAFYAVGTVKNYATDTDADTLIIPSGVTYIGDFAFYGSGYRQADGINGEIETGGIDIIIIGEGVEYIGRCAFYGFRSVRTVTIGGASVIGDKAFFECPTLEKITVLSDLKTVGERAFSSCTSLREVILPDTLKTIGAYAFYKCNSLVKVNTGSALEEIGSFAFFGDSSLKDIYLPASLKTIGDQAFRGCDAILSLTLGASIEKIGDHAFYSCGSLTLYVHKDSLADNWSTYYNSTFVPVVWGCELSDYVISVTVSEGSISNAFASSVISAPNRADYVFVGWSVNAASVTAEYSMDDIKNVSDGTTLYAVWHSTK